MGRKTVNVTEAAQQEAAKGGGDFQPLAAGIYNVTVVDAEETKIDNPKSVNNGFTSVRMQFRISDGQKGANRRLFQTVYDVERWANKDGSDPKDANGVVIEGTGSVNWLFSQFYKSLGVDMTGAVDLPEIEDLLGKSLAVKIKIVPDTYKYNKAAKDGTLGDRTKSDFLTNEISEFLPEQEISDVEDDAAEDDEEGFAL